MTFLISLLVNDVAFSMGPLRPNVNCTDTLSSEFFDSMFSSWKNVLENWDQIFNSWDYFFIQISARENYSKLQSKSVPQGLCRAQSPVKPVTLKFCCISSEFTYLHTTKYPRAIPKKWSHFPIVICNVICWWSSKILLIIFLCKKNNVVTRNFSEIVCITSERKVVP